MATRITAARRDQHGRITHLRLDDARLVSMADAVAMVERGEQLVTGSLLSPAGTRVARFADSKVLVSMPDASEANNLSRLPEDSAGSLLGMAMPGSLMSGSASASAGLMAAGMHLPDGSEPKPSDNAAVWLAMATAEKSKKR